MGYLTIQFENIVTILLFVIGLVAVIWAQFKISSAYKKYKIISSKKNISGVEAARMILDNNGLTDIYVVETKGELTDHYDPSRKVIRLSDHVFNDTSIASLSIAAHECGHAIQDKENYRPMKLRSMLVPVVNLVTYLGYFVSIIALFIGMTQYIMIGIIIILATLVFQLVTLPVEIDASKRANEQLYKLGLIDSTEQSSVKNMLDSAALTYVASFVSTVLNLLRLIIIANNSRED